MPSILFGYLFSALELFLMQPRDIENNTIIKQVFTDKETAELNYILSYTDSLLIAQTKSKCADSAYHLYYDYMINENNSNSQLTHVKTKTIEFIDSLIHHNKPFYSKIWRIEIGMNKNKEVVSHALAFNSDGKYMEFLELFARKKQEFDYYYTEHIYLRGGISPHASGKYIANHKKYNFTNDINRLIASIHLITINYEKDISPE